MDNEVPGGVYLCQVDEQVSCGACCGLYNVADTSAAGLAGILGHRTRCFADVPRTAAAIDDFARRMGRTEPQERPFDHFHHCPFIGLIGPRRSRVGCLLHPLADGNQGVDYRGLSYYGGMACRSYFCPTTHHLSARYKRIIRSVIRDWHLYGLIITETKLLEVLFQRLDRLLARPVDSAEFKPGGEAGRRLVELFRLKLTWPYRPRHADTVCHYFFTDPPYRKPPVNYQRLGIAPSPYADVFEELSSDFHSAAAVADAEQLIESRLRAVAEVLVDSLK